MSQPDIRTPEGREEIRREAAVHYQPLYRIPWPDHEAALDGLDIAQEMAWGYQVEDALLGMPKWERWDHWYDAALDFLDDALAKWDNWQGGPE